LDGANDVESVLLKYKSVCCEHCVLCFQTKIKMSRQPSLINQQNSVTDYNALLVSQKIVYTYLYTMSQSTKNSIWVYLNVIKPVQWLYTIHMACQMG